MTTAGAVFVGATATMALMDGGLSATVGSAAFGYGVYHASKRLATAPTRAVVDDQLRRLKLAVELANQEPDPAVRAKRLKLLEAKRKLVESDAKLALQGDDTTAKLIGIGTFAFPAVGVAVLVGQSTHRWAPQLRAHYVREGLEFRPKER